MIPNSVMRRLLLLLVSGAVLPGTTGCGVGNLMPNRTVHQRCGWNAEEYFTDPKVIALCHAIEANDLVEMERLVKDGADVNAQGKGKMTPLLWAFPDNKLPRFKWLLEQGANPNVVVEDEFNTKQMIARGDSVTQMACMSSFPGYFDAVFDHGGDPNLRRAPGGLGYSRTPLFSVLTSASGGKFEKVKRLIDLGADLNAFAAGTTAVIQAVSWGGQCELALLLLNSGADFRQYEENGMQRLVHVVVRQERRLTTWSSEKQARLHELVKWLEDHGESYEAAKADIARWDSWSGEEFREKMDAEIADRKARE